MVSQLERAGFEVHSVENTGVHYSVTIERWLANWQQHRGEIVAKYGEFWYRLWCIFLSWSVCIAAQGSSTVFMITCHKNRSTFDRKSRFIRGEPIATQS